MAFIFRNRQTKNGAAVGSFSKFTTLLSKRQERESIICKKNRLLRACVFFLVCGSMSVGNHEHNDVLF
jgi:hypothetical protein